MTNARKLTIGILACALLIFASTFWAASADTNPSATASTNATTTQADTSWLHFFNLDLQNDADQNNNLNFGGNSAVTTAEAGKADLKNRMSQDPALGAAVIAYTDCIVHTRYLGSFYESAKHDWAEAINQAKDNWIADHDAYQAVLDKYWQYMDNVATVTLDTNSKKSVDQMYMNPYVNNVNGSPDVIVLATTQDTGPWLTFNFDKIKPSNAKAEEYVMALRVPCGYQPSNVSKLMNITPVTKPVPSDYVANPPQDRAGTSSGGGSSSTEWYNPSTWSDWEPSWPSYDEPSYDEPSYDEPSYDEPDEPSYEPDPDPEPDPGPTWYPKDPSQSSSSGYNDDPGSGDWTGDSDYDYSSDEQPGNSGFYDNMDQYDDSINQNEEANNMPVDNTPTYTPETTPDYVDNNADAGTGYGGVDTPTAPSEPVVDGTAEEWAGPPD